MNRRDFVVRTGAAAAAGLGIARAALALASPAPTDSAVLVRRPCKVLFDQRFESCRSFAAGAERLGCSTQSIAGDVTALWFDQLHPSWVRGERTLAGMTTASSLFCLEQLARDHWMRVSARIEHQRGRAGTLRHRLELHEPTMQQVTAVLATDTRWPERLAAPLLSGLSLATRGTVEEKLMLTRTLARDVPGVPLVTWVISASGAPAAIV